MKIGNYYFDVNIEEFIEKNRQTLVKELELLIMSINRETSFIELRNTVCQKITKKFEDIFNIRFKKYQIFSLFYEAVESIECDLATPAKLFQSTEDECIIILNKFIGAI